MTETNFHQDYLRNELAERCRRNSRYSIRAFAKALKVDVAALSRVLSGKQVPSVKMAKKIFAALDIPPTEQARFLSSLAETIRAKGLQRMDPLLKKLSRAPKPAALKRNQKQVLEKAVHSLENDPIEERSHTSMTMAIDPKNLPAAKKLISQFNRSLCDLLESGEQQQVYNLGICLYPVQKKNQNKENKI